MTTASNAGTILDAALLAQDLPEFVNDSSRAAALRSLEQALAGHADSLVALAADETGLGIERLTGELVRTRFQLLLFADMIADGGHRRPVVDAADPAYPPAPRPDLRRELEPRGPVLNFAASNFPFAFSVLGGDSVAALAAGCSVIVKTSPGHPELSARVAHLAQDVFASLGLSSQTIQIVDDEQVARDVLQEPRLKVATFTGSTSAGSALARIAATRPAPIPFYGELGSINPVVVTPNAAHAQATELAKGLVGSVSGSAGQFCTKPGVVFVPDNADHFVNTAIEHFEDVPKHRMLSPRIGEGYLRHRDQICDTDGVRVLAADDASRKGLNLWVTPTLAETTLDRVLDDPTLVRTEVFGPFCLFVRYRTLVQLVDAFPKLFIGNLTSTIRHTAIDLDEVETLDHIRALLSACAATSGRVLLDGWPTGVSVTAAMQHGGPWPSSTDASTTSVGPNAINRFLRPVTYQSAPDVLLPEGLRKTV
ncbi:aldehyde dehydrogenase family protein [Acrocarpospora catenulata]|uniref:aldehyde dehydrogenase family protein n=1 Tax=Acrocarpospora catenulata TaxID=2836182 RepID=UPI001BD921C6|nr:aldehyde dehydrogenase family protein [Acrocarpospora catenulata]